jgi:hypothetical protein
MVLEGLSEAVDWTEEPVWSGTTEAKSGPGMTGGVANVIGSEARAEEEVKAGEMTLDLLIGLEEFPEAAPLILASHCPLTRSTDLLPAECPGRPPIPSPSPTLLDPDLAKPSSPTDMAPPSKPAAILATFRLMGVEGGEEFGLTTRDGLPAVCDGEERWPLTEDVRSSRRVWYAKMEGDEAIPLGGEGAEGSDIVGRLCRAAVC